MSGRDGGAAYPSSRVELSGNVGIARRETFGLTVRQAYKIAALTGCKPQFQFIDNKNLVVSATEELSKYCGAIADAMLAEDTAFAKEQGNG